MGHSTSIKDLNRQRMNILENIAAVKLTEVNERKTSCPVRLLERSIFFTMKPLSLRKALSGESSPAIIAEFKRRSPSKGTINETSTPGEVSKAYEAAGASAISVLTDSDYFGGSLNDLLAVCQSSGSPVLRKDFIIDEYQIIEARSYGADAILLITELLAPKRMEKLHRFANSVGLEVLVEVHNSENISKVPSETQIIGVNSRNLNTFEVNIDHPAELIRNLPDGVVKVAESGIKSADDCIKLYRNGFDAFLIGEYFMRDSDPGKVCKNFIDEIRNLQLSSSET